MKVLPVVMVIIIQALFTASLSFGQSLDLGQWQEQQVDFKPSEVINWYLDKVIADGVSGRYQVLARLTTKNDFTLYTDKVKFEPAPGFTLADMSAPPTEKLMDPISRKEVDVYKSGEFILTFDGPKNLIGEDFPLSITFLGCTTRICLFPHTEKFTLAIISGKVEIPGDEEKNDTSNNQPTAASPQETSVERELADLVGSDRGLLIILLGVFIGGILTNLTPCVYPMIPITIRVLARQTAKPLVAGLFYAFGIFLTYAVGGITAALTGTLFGAFMGHPLVNIGIAAIMFLLALTMLGYANFTFLQTLGNRFGSKKSGLFNAFLMGAGAGLVASPCTGPILAALLTYISKSGVSIEESSGLMAAYSAGFALPYVFLGGVAGHLKSLQIRAGVQIAVKIAFAGVMIAVGLYYLKTPFYKELKILSGYDWLIISTIALGLGAFGFGMVVGNPKWQTIKSKQIWPSILLGIGIFGLSQTSRPNPGDVGVNWLKSEDQAKQLAVSENKPIYIDLWAEWCEACKQMDATTFRDSKVITELNENWIPLKLDLTELNDENEAIQEKYGVNGLPTSVFLHYRDSEPFVQTIPSMLTAREILVHLNQFRREGKLE